MSWLQLIAYGAQDIYLTAPPQTTFFNTVYRRHTNFSIDSTNSNNTLITPKSTIILYKIKLIELDDNEEYYSCPVTFIKLIEYTRYITCSTCKKHFHESVFEDWLITQKTCPHCRKKWDDEIIIYINKDKLEDNEIFNEDTGTISREDKYTMEELKAEWITNYFEEFDNNLTDMKNYISTYNNLKLI